jgi:hypothetical protein
MNTRCFKTGHCSCTLSRMVMLGFAPLGSLAPATTSWSRQKEHSPTDCHQSGTSLPLLTLCTHTKSAMQSCFQLSDCLFHLCSLFQSLLVPLFNSCDFSI